MDSPATASAAGESPNEKPAGEPGEPVIRTSRHAGLRDSVLGTRNLMTVAALGVVGAIMVVPLTYLSLIVAVVSGLVMGVIGAFLTPQGPPAILGNVFGSLLVGAPVAVLLYRRWTWWVYAISGVVFGGFNASVYGSGFQIALTRGQVSLGIVLSIASCWAGVAVCLLLKRALARTGVGVTR